MSFIPLDGTTYPLLLTTVNPPYEELIVNLTVKETTVKDFIVISPSVLTFKKGAYNVNYTVNVNSTFPNPKLTISYELSGKDSG